MPKTYDPIQSHTLVSNQSSVTFTSIPGTFTDLVIVMLANTSVLEDTGMQFNGDTGSNYSITRMTANGSTAGSARLSSQTNIRIGDANNAAASLSIINVQNYANTTTNKTAILRSNKPDSVLFATVGLWRSTAAITSITVFPYSGNWLSGGTFTLYGIKAA